MKELLEKIIINNEQGLFLLDAPTGFGKTTVIVDIIRKFLKKNNMFSSKKRIFFVTNLKTNLPFQDVIKDLSKEEKEQCLLAKATNEYIIDNFLKVEIDNKDIINSKEYKELKIEIENLESIKKEYNSNHTENLKISKNILYDKISNTSEPNFRKLIKENYFRNKSIKDKKEFIKKNKWFSRLYPICELEKYKVIFLTTQKFIMPIDTFVRVPFYLYSDDFSQESLFFIDEFDASKKVILNKIVEDGWSNKIDILKLFLDLHFALQNFVIPKLLLHTSEYNKEHVKEGKWYTSEEHINYWKKEFNRYYEEYNVKYLMKSVDFKYKKAFLFDDGLYFSIIKDNSRKYLYTQLDKQAAFLKIIATGYNKPQGQIRGILRNLEYSILGLARSIFYIANNYRHYKNESKQSFEIQYTFEESVLTVLDAFNLDENEKQYLFKKIQSKDFDLKSYNIRSTDGDNYISKGFNITEIEDSEYHDMKSVIHNYSFYNTPEDVMINLANHALVIGISATAKIPTCIGNYDLKYLQKKLYQNYISPSLEDIKRIEQEFTQMINKTKGKYKINVAVVDDFNVFSDKDKCKILINKIFDENTQKEVLDMLNGHEEYYYFLIALKIAYIYNEMKTKQFKSFIGFLNSFPQDKGRLNRVELEKLLNLIDKNKPQYKIKIMYITASEFDEKLREAHEHLSNDEAVFILTTYQTVGTGKNIQYDIPNNKYNDMIIVDKDYKKKDFDAIYLLTPTNLIQSISFYSENKYNDLATFLFQQEYLYRNGYLQYYEMKNNMINAFRNAFFDNSRILYKKNGDTNYYTFSLVMQAVGRICRCRNKNKNIYLFVDSEIVDRLNKVSKTLSNFLYNEEFRALIDIGKQKINVNYDNLSKQNKKTYEEITQLAWRLRNNSSNISEWKQLREYVLKNPTSKNIVNKYNKYYFYFEDKCNGYSYKQNRNYDFIEITMSDNNDMCKVSEQDCDLPIILEIPFVKDMFQEKGYAQYFKKEKYIMTPSLYKQIYKGALGEEVGKCIIKNLLSWNLEDLNDIEYYEYFDYKYKNIYFDFKHWNEFIKDNDTYSQKILNKLNKVKGSVCCIVNLIKRTDAHDRISVDERIIQIPYLIDPETSELNYDILNIVEYLNN